MRNSVEIHFKSGAATGSLRGTAFFGDRSSRRPGKGRRGVTLVEVIVVFAIIVLVFLFMLMMIPRGREQARLLGCQKNLGQIGIALAMYDQFQQQLPTVATLSSVDDAGTTRSPGPLRILLETLQLPDLTELNDPGSPVPPRADQVPTEIFVPGFVCSSDRAPTSGWFGAHQLPCDHRRLAGR